MDSKRQDPISAERAVLPKADIHLHAETRARVDRFLSLREGRSPYDWQAWSRQLRQMPAGIERLEALKRNLDVPELDRLGRDHFVGWVADAMLSAALDGAVLVEIRFGAGWESWPDLMPKFREAERLTQSVYLGFCAEAIISVVSPARPEGDRLFDLCLEAKDAGLAGIDFIPILYELEAGRTQWEAIHSWADRASDAGLGITVHAGEFSSADLLDALRVPSVTRIGHAVHSASSTSLLDELRHAGATVECCLTSNVVLGAVPSLEEHPIRTLVDAGIPVTLCSDDPLSVNTTIGAEYVLAASLGLEPSELLEFTRNGIVASFTSPERKKAVLSQIERYGANRDLECLS